MKKSAVKKSTPPDEASFDAVRVQSIQTLNLKSIDVEFPYGKLNAITGPSGSGKTALAVHTICGASLEFAFASTPGAEFDRSIIQPKYSNTQGLIPAIDILALARKLTGAGTVADLLGLNQELATLTAHRGAIRCGRSDCAMSSSDLNQTVAALEAMREKAGEGSRVLIGAEFRHEQFMGKKTSPKKNLPWFHELMRHMIGFDFKRFVIGSRAVRIDEPLQLEEMKFTAADLEAKALTVILDTFALDNLERSRLAENLERVFNTGSKLAVLIVSPREAKPFESGEVDSEWPRLTYTSGLFCSTCGRTSSPLTPELAAAEIQQMNPSSDEGILGVFISGLRLPQALSLSFCELMFFLKDESETYSRLKSAIDVLASLGLDNLPPARIQRSLSSGERIKLVCAYLKLMSITETLLVLDEASRVLHPYDLELVSNWCRSMLADGNTVLAVEHNEKFLSSSDTILELGPEGGKRGGEIVYFGAASEWKQSAPTAKPLKKVKVKKSAAVSKTTLKFPLGSLTALVGRSGSGKSRLLAELEDSRGALDQAHKKFSQVFKIGAKSKQIASSAIEISGILRPIAELYAALPLARRIGFSADDLMLLTPAACCEGCEGRGVAEFESGAFGTELLPCDICAGGRYNSQAKDIAYNSLPLGSIFLSSVSELLAVFGMRNEIASRLQTLDSFGLSELRMGSYASELSASDRQRLLLCAQLISGVKTNSLFLLEQPFAGVDLEKIPLLIKKLKDILKNKAAMVFTTHSQNVIREADFVIELSCGEATYFGAASAYSLEGN